MHVFSIGYWELLSLPITVFWELSQNADRIKADNDQRQFALLSNIVGGDPQKYLTKLEKERGQVIEINDPEQGFDKAGMNRLKSLMKG